MLDTAWQDLRHGTRMLAKTPGFTLVAVFSIAIGVGANTAMFSVADGLIFRPLGVPEASALVTVSIAAYIPARRAASIDPLTALQQD